MADGDQTIVLTSHSTEAGKHISPIERNGDVWEIVATATFDADDTTDVTLTTPFNGIVRNIALAVPDTTNAITTQMQIQDNSDNVVFDTGELAENATYTFSIDEALSGTIDIIVGVSGAVGASGSVIVATIRGI